MRVDCTTPRPVPQVPRPPRSAVAATGRPEAAPPAIPLSRAELAAFERAHAEGYLVVRRGQWRTAWAWFCRCARLDRLFVCVERRGRLSEVRYDAYSLCCDLDADALRAIRERFEMEAVHVPGRFWACTPAAGHVYVRREVADELAAFLVRVGRDFRRRHRAELEREDYTLLPWGHAPFPGRQSDAEPARAFAAAARAETVQS